MGNAIQQRPREGFMSGLTQNRACPICSSSNSILVREFPESPLGDNLCESLETSKRQPLLPMNLVICNKCSHIYLLDVVSPDLTYKSYSFKSSRSPGLQNSMKSSKEFLEMNLTRGPRTVLDIGANDGTWLTLFNTDDCDVFGIEPSASHINELKSMGISCYEGYFDSGAYESVKDWLNGRTLDLITINNTFANIENLNASMELLYKLATEETVVSIITGYHFEQFAAGMYDYVYHEHLSYLSVKDLVFLANEYGFNDMQARTFPLKGGSLQFIFSKRKRRGVHFDEIQRRVQHEGWILEKPETYASKVSNDITRRVKVTQNVSRILRNNKSNLVGYGFAHSSSTLIYMCGLQEILARLVDDNNLRWGLFSPGCGLEIGNPSSINPSFESILILAWQHEHRIATKLRGAKKSISFSNPLGTIYENIEE